MLTDRSHPLPLCPFILGLFIYSQLFLVFTLPHCVDRNNNIFIRHWNWETGHYSNLHGGDSIELTIQLGRQTEDSEISDSGIASTFGLVGQRRGVSAALGASAAPEGLELGTLKRTCVEPPTGQQLEVWKAVLEGKTASAGM